MKKTACLIIAILAIVIFASENGLAQQKLTSNKYFDWGKINPPDTIPYEKIMEYITVLDVYRPIYHNDMFLVMKGLDEDKQFIFHLASRKVGKKQQMEWCKIKIPIDTPYMIAGFNLVTNVTFDHKESYQILCQTSNGKIRSFIFDIDSGTLKEAK